MDKKFINLLLILLLIKINIIYGIEEYQDDEDDEHPIYYVNFDLSDPNFKYKNSGEKIENIVTDQSFIRIPEIILVKEGFYFNGWTTDFIYGYEPGDVFNMKVKNTTLFPVFEDKNDTTYFRFEYRVEYNGEITDVSKELRPSIERAKHFIKIKLNTYSNKYARSFGWTDGENIFNSTIRFIMPRKNVTLYAIFYNLHNFSYSHGDVDGIVGNPDKPFVYTEGAIIDLAEPTRLRRKGYEIIGWHCEYDGKDYPIFYPYKLPDADVVMTAIWKPLEYNVLFITHVSSIPNIRIKGKTNDIIIVPNINGKREGYDFIGWIIYENEFYKPGEELIVKGQEPGLGIEGSAIWIQK